MYEEIIVFLFPSDKKECPNIMLLEDVNLSVHVYVNINFYRYIYIKREFVTSNNISIVHIEINTIIKLLLQALK